MKLVTTSILVLASAVVVPHANGQFQLSTKLPDDEYSALIKPIVESVATSINEHISLPRPVEITSGACQVQNAFFVPRAANNVDTIVLCTELLALMAGEIRGLKLDENQAGIAFLSETLFVLLHEMGHSLISVLELPLLGQEEDAADQFAAYVMSSEHVLALWAARLWNHGNSRNQLVPLGAFSDQHGLGPQRYFNILCWTYGADPPGRAFVAQLSSLPAERARTCPNEYNLMRTSWERLLKPFSKQDLLDNEEPSRNASGQWRFIESMDSGASRLRCSASGTIELWQLGDSFDGTMRQEGTCIVRNVPVDNSTSGQVTDGNVTGDQLRFVAEKCTYTGEFKHQHMRMEGSVECAVDGSDKPMTGTWQAVR